MRVTASPAYSYGDSAGFAPDFPFNPAGREPLSAANVGKDKVRERIFFIRLCRRHAAVLLFAIFIA
jgi:hypothetical protein